MLTEWRHKRLYGCRKKRLNTGMFFWQPLYLIDHYENRFKNEMGLSGGSMEELKGYQKKFLKARAHGRKPVVFIGQKGLADNLIGSIHDALNTHELIKVKFIEFKEKQQKIDMAVNIETEASCRLAGMIGHIAIFYRQHPDPEKRKIQLPHR
jgi:RNA-binding protein